MRIRWREYIFTVGLVWFGVTYGFYGLHQADTINLCQQFYTTAISTTLPADELEHDLEGVCQPGPSFVGTRIAQGTFAPRPRSSPVPTATRNIPPSTARLVALDAERKLDDERFRGEEVETVVVVVLLPIAGKAALDSAKRDGRKEDRSKGSSSSDGSPETGEEAQERDSKQRKDDERTEEPRE